MATFSYEQYKEVINRPKQKIYRAKLTDELEVTAHIESNGIVILRAIYKGSDYVTSFDENDVGSYQKHWNSKTKNVKYYLPEFVDEYKTGN